MSSFINTFFVDQYDYPKVAVGLFTWPFIVSGSFLRPFGGALADKIGGIRMLTVLYLTAIVTRRGHRPDHHSPRRSRSRCCSS